jgi:fatty acid desaturase
VKLEINSKDEEKEQRWRTTVSWRRPVKLENNIKARYQQSFTTVLQIYCCSTALIVISSFYTVLQLYCFSPALLLFPIFTVVLQLYCCSNSNKGGEE